MKHNAFLGAVPAMVLCVSAVACGSSQPADSSLQSLDASAQPDASPEADGFASPESGIDAAKEADADAPPAYPFRIGTGIGDITGPPAELGMMGYAMVDQRTAGLHTRLWSRAFVIEEPMTSRRVVFVNTDLLAVFQSVRQEVLARLATTYGTLYTADNVLLAATHTHAGPGAYSHYTEYNLTTFGFNKQNFEAIVDGITTSITRAHEHLQPAAITIATGELANASINRSPTSYLENPASERAAYDSDIDRTMTVLRLTAEGGAPLGVINFFGVHGTSMGNDNLLISGDNKGYAAYQFERHMGADYLAERPFVAAFAQTTEGDSTPNIYGGTDGGGADDFESTALSGNKQYEAALDLYEHATERVDAVLDYRHAHVKMDDVKLTAAEADGVERTTCPAALGLSKIAGADDGPGYGTQGQSCDELAQLVTALMCTPKYTECQAEKPVVLETGSQQPHPWSPQILPLQVVRIGSLAVVALPFETTTMSGRRIRQDVISRLGPSGVTRVIVLAPANAYGEYLTTREEYKLQRYEGAATVFGPFQLAAVRKHVGILASALANGSVVDPGPAPPDMSGSVKVLTPGVVYDDKLLKVEFGDVVTDAPPKAERGETVSVTFWGAHPNNNLHRGGSYLTVERKEAGTWKAVAHDWDWETRFHWKRNNCLPTLGCSHVTIDWSIPADVVNGTYRIHYYGDWLSVLSEVTPFEGVSREIEVE